MRIAAEARYLLAAEKSGVEHYTYGLLSAMARLLTDDDLLLYVHRAPRADEREMLAPFLGSRRCRFRAVPPLKLWLKLWMPLAARLDRADVGIFPGSILPWYLPFPSAMVVHDLCWSVYPECYPAREIAIFRDLYPRCLAAAGVVFAVSEWTKQDIQRVYGTSPEKIRIVPCAADPRFAPVPDAAERVRAACGIEPGYLLAVGTLHPRKNVATLLQAYSLMGAAAPPLVLVGPAGGMSDSLRARADELGIGERVRWLHYVPQELLAALYSAAGVFAMPSLYEGFGIPVVEAMTCGAPVVCSSTTVFPEITAGAAILVDPQDARALAEALTSVLADSVLAQNLRERGVQRARAFDWSRSAARALSFLRELCPPSPPR